MARRKTVRLRNGQFEGLDLSPGGTFDDVKSLVAAARRIARDEGLDWRVVPYGAESASKRSRRKAIPPRNVRLVPPPGSRVTPARAWELAYALQERRDVRAAEPSFVRARRRSVSTGPQARWRRRRNPFRVQRGFSLGDRRELRAGGLGGAGRRRHRRQAPGRRHPHRSSGHGNPAAHRASELGPRPRLGLRLRRRRCGSDRPARLGQSGTRHQHRQRDRQRLRRCGRQGACPASRRSRR